MATGSLRAMLKTSRGGLDQARNQTIRSGRVLVIGQRSESRLVDILTDYARAICGHGLGRFSRHAYLLDNQNPRGVLSSANGLCNLASANSRACLRALRFRSAHLPFWPSPDLETLTHANIGRVCARALLHGPNAQGAAQRIKLRNTLESIAGPLTGA